MQTKHTQATQGGKVVDFSPYGDGDRYGIQRALREAKAAKTGDDSQQALASDYSASEGQETANRNS